MRRHIPNLLTASRLLMAIAFFIILGFYDAEREAGWPILDVAFVVFLVAVCTDMVDGYLARRLGHQTVLGRIADPFVDKILICGALAYFVGDQFIIVREAGSDLVNLTGWQTWMVVLVIARELLVTGMRGFSESQGISFAASWSGKIKMILQCTAISWSLFWVAHWTDGPPWTHLVRDILIWATTVFTAASALVYIKRAYDLLRLPPE